MPKQQRARSPPHTPTSHNPTGASSPYFQQPVTSSPYFNKTIISNRSSQPLVLVEECPQSRKSAGPVKRKGAKALSSTPDKALRLVLREPHCDRSVPMPLRLLAVRPRLLQALLHHTPWWLLIAVILLNKTTGKAATPILYKIMARWPTMEALSRACVPELQEILTPLGLASIRSQRLILFANMYLNDPPSASDLRPSRVQVAKGEPKYPPTMISHLPGMGRYALDSFRLFCCKLAGDGDWRNVMPLDKELRVYARWRWAVVGFVWDSERGVLGPVNERYLNDLCEGTLSPTCSAPDYVLHGTEE